jgi:hypothetical protein
MTACCLSGVDGKGNIQMYTEELIVWLGGAGIFMGFLLSMASQGGLLG